MPKTINYLGTLNHHTKLHKGEKNFKCETCNKAWVRKSRLIAHMRTHTGEKPFKCDVCQKDFSRNDLLKKHLKSHRLQVEYLISRPAPLVAPDEGVEIFFLGRFILGV